MQPTHARWEVVPPSEVSRSSNQLVEDMSALRLITGSTPKVSGDGSLVANDNHDGTGPSQSQLSGPAAPASSSFLPPVPPSIYAKRLAVTDVLYETAETSTLGRPGPDGDVQDIGPNGIISMANPQHPEFVSAEILAELPPECKDALVEAAVREYSWKSKWRSETADGARGHILQGYNWHA